MSSWWINTNGGDPELGIFDAEGKSIPAHVAGIPKTKTRVPVGAWGDWTSGTYFRDGWAVEFNPPPQGCRAGFYGGFAALVHGVSALLAPKQQRLIAVPAWEVDLKWMEDAPDDVKETGCSPAFSAYTGVEERPDLNLLTHPMRYAGGHMHLGVSSSGSERDFYLQTTGVRDHNRMYWRKDDDDDFKTIAWVIRAFDRTIGLLDTYLWGSPEAKARRQYYGKAGEFRLQIYGTTTRGIEYRTPGPEMWVAPPVLSGMYGLARTIFCNWDKFAEVYPENIEHQKQVRAAINAGESSDSLLDLMPEMPFLVREKTHLRAVKKYVHATYPRDLVNYITHPSFRLGASWGWTEMLTSVAATPDQWKNHFYYAG